MRVLVACEFSGVVRDAFRALGHDAWSCDLLPTNAPGRHFMGDVTLLLEGWTPVTFAGDCDPEGTGLCRVSGEDVGDCPCLGPTQEDVEYLERPEGLFGRPVAHPHWDLLIAHPPCTYLTSAAEWAYRDGPYHQRVKPGTLVGAARRQAREDALAFVLALAAAPVPRIAIENPVGVLSSRWRRPDQIIQPWQFGHDASKATCLWLQGLPPLQPTCIIAPRVVNSRPRWGNQTDSGQNRLSPSEDRWKLRSVTYQGIAEAMATQWTATGEAA